MARWMIVGDRNLSAKLNVHVHDVDVERVVGQVSLFFGERMDGIRDENTYEGVRGKHTSDRWVSVDARTVHRKAIR